jgi:hypothetical protein
MGFMVGRSSAESSLKLHLLQLEMRPKIVRSLLETLGRQLDDDGQNKLFKINGSKANSS